LQNRNPKSKCKQKVVENRTNGGSPQLFKGRLFCIESKAAFCSRPFFLHFLVSYSQSAEKSLCDFLSGLCPLRAKRAVIDDQIQIKAEKAA